MDVWLSRGHQARTRHTAGLSSLLSHLKLHVDPVILSTMSGSHLNIALQWKNPHMLINRLSPQWAKTLGTRAITPTSSTIWRRRTIQQWRLTDFTSCFEPCGVLEWSLSGSPWICFYCSSIQAKEVIFLASKHSETGLHAELKCPWARYLIPAISIFLDSDPLKAGGVKVFYCDK